MHGAALDRPRAHQRHLDREVVEVLRQRARQHLHLRPALDLEHAGRLGRPDRPEGLGVVDRDPREVDPLAARPGDLVDAALDRRQHPQPEQVDLQEAGVRARVLVPLDELAPLHRRRLHRADVDQRPGRDHHPAGVLGGVAREPPRLARQAGKRPPARRRGPLRADRLRHVRSDRLGAVEHVDRAGHPLDLARRQAERLAEVADRAARPVAGERRDQRRALRAVALVDAGDQLLADVAREVEVDVGRLGDLLVQEAPQEEPVAHRVDVREPGQVADDRADARAAAPAGGQERRAASPAPAPRPRPRGPARACRSGAGRSRTAAASGSPRSSSSSRRRASRCSGSPA